MSIIPFRWFVGPLSNFLLVGKVAAALFSSICQMYLNCKILEEQEHFVGNSRLYKQDHSRGRRLTTTGQPTNSFLPTFLGSRHEAMKEKSPR